MISTELRINNIVDVINRSGSVHLPTGIELRVIATGLFKAQCIPNEIKTYEATADVIMNIPLEDLVGLPLTEYWLKSFGCIEQRINSRKKNYWNKELDFSVDVEFTLDGNLYFYNIAHGRQKHIMYVHKLQNLHYELKGEELQISPTSGSSEISVTIKYVDENGKELPHHTQTPKEK